MFNVDRVYSLYMSYCKTFLGESTIPTEVFNDTNYYETSSVRKHHSYMHMVKCSMWIDRQTYV